MSDIISQLISGISNFAKKECFPDSPYNDTVTKGQSPKAMVIGCSDSLVDPILLTGAKPGELFIHRNIAGLVPQCQDSSTSHYYGTSSVLEYGIARLKVEHLIILGHACCGGIAELLAKNEFDGFLGSWIEMALPAKNKIIAAHKDKTLQQQRHLCEKEAIKLSLQNLMTFPFVKKRVEEDSLILHGWYFDRGNFSIYNREKDIFEKKC